MTHRARPLRRVLTLAALAIIGPFDRAFPATTGAERPQLLRAAAAGDVAQVERLFLQGQDLNQTGAGGETALHAAAAAAQDKIVEWLIAHEASVTVKDASGRTPADISTELGHRTTSMLLKRFMLLQSIERLAVQDESWDSLADALTRDSRHYTLLHVLAIKGSVEEARSRIKAGADLEAKTTLGMTPLMKAAGVGGAEMVRLLLKAGADVNARDLLDNTPLIASVVSGNENVIRLLIDAGADLNVHSRNGGGTALELAQKMGRREKVVEILRQAGAK